MSFNALHGETRTLEGQCDKLLSDLSALIRSPTDDTQLSEQIRENLAQRSTNVDSLYRLAYEPGSSNTMLHQAQRHSENLTDHTAAFKRLSGELSQERNRRNLLSSVRDDIEAHRAASAAAAAASEADANQYYGLERGRVDDANSFADNLLSRAYETRNELMRQQATIKDVQRRILKVVGQFPGLNSIIGKINSRQKRNSLILAGVIVFCVCFIVFVR